MVALAALSLSGELHLRLSSNYECSWGENPGRITIGGLSSNAVINQICRFDLFGDEGIPSIDDDRQTQILPNKLEVQRFKLLPLREYQQGI